LATRKLHDELHAAELVEGIFDFKIDVQLATLAEQLFRGTVDLRGGPTPVAPAAPQQPPGENRFPEFLLLRFIEQAEEDAGIVVKILEVQAAGQAELILVLRPQVAEERFEPIA